MPHSRVAKQVMRTARKTTRRPGYSSSTKAALLDSARDLFTQHGYAGTSLDEVVAAARVTKGALYHHFPSKLALFESVFLDVQDATSKEVSEAIATSKRPVGTRPDRPREVPRGLPASAVPPHLHAGGTRGARPRAVAGS